jgi:lipoate-protein ligase A
MVTSPLYTHFKLPVSYQMALDQALFEELRTRSCPLFLRFYTMERSSATIGHFSGRGKSLELLETMSRQIPVVRRLTGGGIVFHGSDLVFSLGADTQAFPQLHSLKESYRLIHSMIAAAFEIRRIPAVLADRKEGVLDLRSPQTSQGLCFDNPVPGDLVAEGKKWAGGAQKRQKSFLLHQGSVAVPPGLTPEVFSQDIKGCFEEGLGVGFQKKEVSPALKLRAQELSNTYYQPLGSRAA